MITDAEMEGKSLKERFRFLNKKITSEKSSEVLSNLPDNMTPLQKVFITSIANKQEDVLILIEQLKSDDIIVIKHALRAKWFFQGKNIPDVDFFMSEVFPNVSFRTMCKMISQFGTHLENESLAEEFYSKIRSVYGYTHSIKILPRCSEDFIHNERIQSKLFLDESILHKIYKRHPKEAIAHLKETLINNQTTKMEPNYNNTLILIAHDYPNIFMDFFAERQKYPYFNKINLGYKTSVKILTSCKANVLDEFAGFEIILNTEAIIDSLKGDDFDKAILQVMSDKIGNFKYDMILKFLKKSKPDYRSGYVCKIYSVKYGQSIFDNSSFLEWPILLEMPKETRIEWASSKVANFVPSPLVSIDFYWKYLDAKVGIPLYKKELNTASTSDGRINILKNMIQCCKINNDEEMLLEVMEFVSKRYRNDLATLRYQFLLEIFYSFSMNKLSKAHWDVVDDMLEIMYLNRDIITNHIQVFLFNILEEQILYMLKHNLDIDPKLDKLHEYNQKLFLLCEDHKEYKDVIFDACLKKYKKVIEQTQQLEYKVLYVETVLRGFDQYGEKRRMIQYDWLISEIDNILKNRNEIDARMILRYLEKDVETKMKYLDVIYTDNCSEELLKNILVHNSEFLEKNIDRFIDYTSTSYNIHKYAMMFNRVRTYLSKPLGDNLINEINSKISIKETKSENASGLIIALCNLLSNKDCEIILTKYIPKETKIDTKNLNKLEYEQAGEICKNLKNINPSISQELLMAFAKHDYLKFALSSLLALAHKYPNEQLQAFIAYLSNQLVSLKKHGIRLAYFLCPPKVLPTFYKRLWVIEKNISIKEVIFARLFKLFIGNEAKESHLEAWNVLKCFIGDIDDSLYNLCTYLAKCNEVDVEILGEYCEISWKALKNLREHKQFTVQSSLLRQLVSVSEYLGDKFCEELFTEYLSDDYNGENYDLEPFILHYIMNMSSKDLQDKHVEEICQLFKLAIVKNWDTMNENGEYAYRNRVSHFVEKCCEYATTSDLKIAPENVLTSIRNMLLSALPNGAHFTMILIIKLTFAYNIILRDLKYANIPRREITLNVNYEQTFVRLGYEIGNIWNQVVEEYGIAVSDVFVEPISTFARFFNDYDFVRKNICIGLIENTECDKSRLLIALNVLPDDLEKYDDLLQKIIDADDKTNLSFAILCDKKFKLPSARIFT